MARLLPFRDQQQVDSDRALLKALGGPAKVAAMLNLGDGGVQRVHNWLSRGIPAAVKVARPDLFMAPHFAANAAPAQEAERAAV